MTSEPKIEHVEPEVHEDPTEIVIQNIGGTFGRFQIIIFILFAIPLALSGSFALSYVFTAMNLDYRCHIPDCDKTDTSIFTPNWLPNSVPYKNGNPSKCYRYASMTSNSSVSLHPGNIPDPCSEYGFNRIEINTCDVFVYKTNTTSILSQFELNCERNEWKLAMVGTVNNIGRFIFMPLMGHLSDSFGRKMVLIIGVFGSSTFAMFRSFSSNYPMFLLFEFLDSSIGSATYSATLILALEWVTKKDRVLVGMLFTATYPLGQIFLGLTARYTIDYRNLIRIIYMPGFLILSYIWIAPESIRWLLAKKKYNEASVVVKRAAAMNNIQLSNRTLDLLNGHCTQSSNDGNPNKSEIVKEPLHKIFTSKLFLIRFLICSFCWISNAFISYGISLTSVSLAGDKYVNFIVVALAGIPAVVICFFMLENLGRPKTLCSALLIGGGAIITSKLVGSQYHISLPVVLYFIGKCFIAVSFSGLYVYTSELWPTSLRHSMMSFCSSAGRVGSMLAPMAPLLSNYIEILPYLIFGLLAIISGVLVLQLPETLDRKLPDTLEEAKQMSVKSEV